MDRKKIFPLLAALLLILCSCADTVKETPSAGENGEGITLHCAFAAEDGAALANDTVRFSNGGEHADYPLDGEGRLTFSGIPRETSLTVAVLDAQGEERGAMELILSQGAVIDVATDGEGGSRVCLREDTEELSLTFTLHGDGTLDCELYLEESNSNRI